jgi:riboflavin synthase alpha subunit
MFTGLVEEVGRVRSLRPAEDAGDAHLGLALATPSWSMERA